jgi:hypothetical protein
MRVPQIVLGLGWMLACAPMERDASGDVTEDTATPTRVHVALDARRSLIVTDRAVLEARRSWGVERFALRRVLGQLADEAAVPGVDAAALFQQLWDTQNPAPGFTGRGAHCDDTQQTLEGQPNSCRPADGKQAAGDGDVALDGYVPTALVNRFDLAPVDGHACGEYRIVYAKSTKTPGRALIIFEAELANPRPELGLEGCRPVQALWGRLSEPGLSPEDRAALLEALYFEGIGGFAPVVTLAAFARGAGQVRTNQFIDRPWTLKEFELAAPCDSGTCDLLFVPVRVKHNPPAQLFAGDDPAFVAELLACVDDLTADALPGISLGGMSEAFDAAESADTAASDYATVFQKRGRGLAAQLASRLAAQGSPLSPLDVVRRAHSQSCIGCHQRAARQALGGGLVWPRSLGFVHVSESLEDGPEGPRYLISPALTDVLLPARLEVMDTFLGWGAAAVVARAERLARGPTRTLGGATVH